MRASVSRPVRSRADAGKIFGDDSVEDRNWAEDVAAGLANLD